MNQPTPQHHWLHYFPTLQANSDPEWLNVIQLAQEVDLPPGTGLYHSGDRCRNYLLVLEGSVRVQKVSEGGREIVLYRVESGQSCILTTACLLSHDSYHAEAITETQVKAISIPAHAFEQALKHSSAFQAFVFDSYGKRLTSLMLLIDAVAFGRMDSRLAHLLTQRCDEHQQILATHQELARELGTAREVVSRLLKNFQRDGWLESQRGVINLTNPDALATLALHTER